MALNPLVTVSRGERGRGCGMHVRYRLAGSSRLSALPGPHAPPGGRGRRSRDATRLLKVVSGPGCLSPKLYRPVAQSLGTRRQEGCHESPAPAGAVPRARVRPASTAGRAPAQVRARLPAQLRDAQTPLSPALGGGRTHRPTGLLPQEGWEDGGRGGCLGRGTRESKARGSLHRRGAWGAQLWGGCVSLSVDGWLCFE